MRISANEPVKSEMAVVTGITLELMLTFWLLANLIIISTIFISTNTCMANITTKYTEKASVYLTYVLRDMNMYRLDVSSDISSRDLRIALGSGRSPRDRENRWCRYIRPMDVDIPVKTGKAGTIIRDSFEAFSSTNPASMLKLRERMITSRLWTGSRFSAASKKRQQRAVIMEIPRMATTWMCMDALMKYVTSTSIDLTTSMSLITFSSGSRKFSGSTDKYVTSSSDRRKTAMNMAVVRKQVMIDRTRVDEQSFRALLSPLAMLIIPMMPVKIPRVNDSTAIRQLLASAVWAKSLKDTVFLSVERCMAYPSSKFPLNPRMMLEMRTNGKCWAGFCLMACSSIELVSIIPARVVATEVKDWVSILMLNEDLSAVSIGIVDNYVKYAQ